MVGADLATNPDERAKLTAGVSLVTQEMAERLESRIDDLVAASPLPEVFIVPGANPVSAALDVARSTIRRAERGVGRARRERAHDQPRGSPLPQPTERPAVRAGATGRRRGRATQPRLKSASSARSEVRPARPSRPVFLRRPDPDPDPEAESFGDPAGPRTSPGCRGSGRRSSGRADATNAPDLATRGEPARSLLRRMATRPPAGARWPPVGRRGTHPSSTPIRSCGS